MEILVGHTGFVGSNLMDQHPFDGGYNSKNIGEAFGLNPDICVYAGIRAEKYLAVNDPAADLAMIHEAIRNIQKINPVRLVLISTIDVYPNPAGVYETTAISEEGANVYGSHRHDLETWVQENLRNYLIIRLPALFGKNLKKNFIYDMIHIIPSNLKAEKYVELSRLEPVIQRSYTLQRNGFYHCSMESADKRELREAFERCGFSALNFTDSRASFQFYNLGHLWDHLRIVLENDLSLVNFAVEPIGVADLYQQIRGRRFVNEVNTKIPRYDFKSIHAGRFEGVNGYIFQKDRVMADIREFIQNEDRKLI